VSGSNETSSSDVTALKGSWQEAFRESRWFTRGWTLQELLAPQSVEFFTRERRRLGSRRDLEDDIQKITRIPLAALRGGDLSTFGVEERLDWLKGRQTTLPEDEAYCLLGIFGIFMPVIYGETRESGMRRLVKKVHSSRRGVSGANAAFRWQPEPNSPIGGDPDSISLADDSVTSLAEFGGNLVAIYRVKWPAKDAIGALFGVAGVTFFDRSLCWQTWKRNGRELISEKTIFSPDSGSPFSQPSIAALGNQLLAVWRSGGTLRYSTSHLGSRQWSSPNAMVVGGFAPHSSPVLASNETNGSTRIYALWKGAPPNQRAYLSWYDGDRWDTPRLLPYIETDITPALTSFRGSLFIAWKISSGQKLYWMRFDTNGNPLNEEPYEVCWRGESDTSPTLAEVGGTVYAAWKGKGSSADSMWLAAWKGEEKRFGPAQVIPDSKTSAAPKLARWGGSLVLAWRNGSSMAWRCGSAE